MSIKLIESLTNGEKCLSELTEDELWSIYNASVANDDYRALIATTNNITGIYEYNVKAPYWLINSFSDQIWHLEIKDNGKIYKKIIDWGAIVLSDNLSLADPKYKFLLNAFKYWITATDNPRENAGKLKKGVSVYVCILNVIKLINSILLHGKIIQLTELHLSGLSDDFLMSLMVKFGENGVINGLYDYTNQVRVFLLRNISSINENQARILAKKYPFITRSLLPEESPLGLSVTDRIKSCYFLSTINYYGKPTVGCDIKYKSINLTGQTFILVDQIFGKKIIPLAASGFPIFEELMLTGKSSFKEFDAIPCTEVSEMMSEQSMRDHISALRLVTATNGMADSSHVPISIMKSISLSRIREHVNLRGDGRYKSLSPQLIFNLIEQCFKFTYEYQDSILNSVLSVLSEGKAKSTQSHSRECELGSTERSSWGRVSAIKLIDRKLKKLGVDRLAIYPSEDDFFKNLRNNKSLFALYSVLIGSIQVLIGVIMAKRIDEILSLKAHGNLYPNIDPSSKKGEVIDYELISNLKKTGSGGEYGRNAKIARPIPRSFALIVWKLENFNKAVVSAGLNISSLSLFNTLSSLRFIMSKVYQTSYNSHLNMVCDYFETPLIIFEDGVKRRHYVRQHQLRRFFAMVFFWSKSFDGLDTLRWMLGHSDMKHLYNYITESVTGEVLNGLKASYIIDSICKSNLDNIQELADLIAIRYGVNSVNISLSTVSYAVADYEDTKDYRTTPNIEKLIDQKKLESHIIELLEEKIISVEPEFFTVEQDGKAIQRFTLTLQVNELK